MEENDAATRQLISLRDAPAPELTDAAALRSHLAAANAAVTECAVLQDRIAQARRVSDLLDDPENAAALRGNIQQSEAELLAAEDECVFLRTQAPDDGLLRREVDRAETELSAARAEESRLRSALAASQERLRAAEALQARTEALRTEITALERTLAVRKRLEQAYGANGIPALILEAQAIPQLEAETQRILQEFDMPFRVELVTQRETKSGIGTASTAPAPPRSRRNRRAPAPSPRDRARRRRRRRRSPRGQSRARRRSCARPSQFTHGLGVARRDVGVFGIGRRGRNSATSAHT